MAHDHGRTLEPGLLRVSVRWQTSISSKFCLKSDTDILKERGAGYSPRFTPPPDAQTEVNVSVDARHHRAYQNSPSSRLTLSSLFCSSTLTVFHSGLHKQKVTETFCIQTRIQQCKSNLSLADGHFFFLLVSNPFISLQGPSHSVLPQGFRSRTISTAP